MNAIKRLIRCIKTASDDFLGISSTPKIINDHLITLQLLDNRKSDKLAAVAERWMSVVSVRSGILAAGYPFDLAHYRHGYRYDQAANRFAAEFSTLWHVVRSSAVLLKLYAAMSENERFSTFVLNMSDSVRLYFWTSEMICTWIAYMRRYIASENCALLGRSDIRCHWIAIQSVVRGLITSNALVMAGRS